MGEQKVITGNIYEKFAEITKLDGVSKIFLVCGKNVANTSVGRHFLAAPNIAAVFQDFESNPSYESARKAADWFRSSACDAILAIGGGSAMDIGKCVKAFAGMDLNTDCLSQQIPKNRIPYYAIPTTAGTGSEATQFAVIYVEDEKHSIEHRDLIPQIVFLDASLLKSLPTYQKKVTMLDALCHCVESFWSVNANVTSREYASRGLSLILENYEGYLTDDRKSAELMLWASYYAGKAINISKTTAAHAMSYKLTKLYGIPHGLAAAICLSHVWNQTQIKATRQDNKNLMNILKDISKLWGCESPEEALCRYREFLKQLNVQPKAIIKKEDLEMLVYSVNTDRMQNHPVIFTSDTIREIYTQILEKEIENAHR